MGFCTLIIAHHLSLTGDTMVMMEAVLDTNFWLATHVVIVTLGYAATFFAGVIAWTIAVMATSTIILDIPLIHPIRGIQAIYLAVGILGVSTRNPRAHAGIAVFFICMAPLIALSVGLRPGPLVR